jgi:hypothetical protein
VSYDAHVPVPVNAAGGAYGNWACLGSSGDRASRGRSADVRQPRIRDNPSRRPAVTVSRTVSSWPSSDGGVKSCVPGDEETVESGHECVEGFSAGADKFVEDGLSFGVSRKHLRAYSNGLALPE